MKRPELKRKLAVELRKLCEARKLPKKGKKKCLVERLCLSYENEQRQQEFKSKNITKDETGLLGQLLNPDPHDSLNGEFPHIVCRRGMVSVLTDSSSKGFDGFSFILLALLDNIKQLKNNEEEEDLWGCLVKALRFIHAFPQHAEIWLEVSNDCGRETCIMSCSKDATRILKKKNPQKVDTTKKGT